MKLLLVITATIIPACFLVNPTVILSDQPTPSYHCRARAHASNVHCGLLHDLHQHSHHAGVLVSANIAATTMSQAIGAAVASVRVANLLGSLAIMMFLLFGGFLLNRDQVPWYCTWIADLSYFNYAYEALAVSTDQPLHSSLIQFGSSVSSIPCN
jgi:hypothetical protein